MVKPLLIHILGEALLRHSGNMPPQLLEDVLSDLQDMHIMLFEVGFVRSKPHLFNAPKKPVEALSAK